MNPLKLIFAIPARYGSTRLPGKPLLPIAGKPMICRVLENVRTTINEIRREQQAGLLEKIEIKTIVATDDVRIIEAVASESQLFGENNFCAVMTAPELKSGTDRIFAAVTQKNSDWSINSQDIVVNIQGDEPFFSPVDIVNLVRKMLANVKVPMGTLVFKRHEFDIFLKSSVVKTIVNINDKATYFSRAPIPWPRSALGASGCEWIDIVASKKTVPSDFSFLHHIGIYAYRWHALTAFAAELRPGMLEITEGLEQLRALEAGWEILAVQALSAPFGIDTPEDLAAVQQHYLKL